MANRQCYVSSWKDIPDDTMPGGMRRALVEDKEFIWDFHGWGIDFEELNNGVGQFTVAILEAECGKIVLLPAHMIRMLPDRSDL